MKGSAAKAARVAAATAKSACSPPLWQRLEQEENPAQRTRRIFTEEGAEGLIELSDLESYLSKR